MQVRSRHVAIVGGGPAGLMAARAAVLSGARVTVLEQRPEPGIKLLATGGGRCNIANTADEAQFLAAFGRYGRHAQPALAAFGLEGLRTVLQKHGIGLESSDGFHLYPAPASAKVVRDALLSEVRRLGVTLLAPTRVTALRVADGVCRGVDCADGRVIEADAVILAAGGAAMPKLGSDGSGYALARSVGHTVRGPWPALVPLATTETWGHRLAGVSLPDVELRVDTATLRRDRWRGAFLFTHHGLSGPAVLDASGALAEALAASGGPLTLRVNLLAERSLEDWRTILAAWRARHGARSLTGLLAGTVPASVAAALAEHLGLPGIPCARWTRAECDAFADVLSGLPFTVTGTEGFGVAMGTRGGVALKEIDPRTSASRLVGGLYVAGEMLDLTGPCGGYNLLWAFSSGHLAGAAAASP